MRYPISFPPAVSPDYAGNMDIHQSLTSHGTAISCVEMHTCGEPVRIIVRGFPSLYSDDPTLLRQRSAAEQNYSHVRRRLMHEPRGHADMYGALLIPTTELTAGGAADIGVLFVHHGGWSTMCGHATLALARFLVDTHDRAIFPRRAALPFDAAAGTVELRLHAPCGVVTVTVPAAAGGSAADPARDASFRSVPCWAARLGLRVAVPAGERWPELAGRAAVTVDVAYGGAFYVVVSAEELGWTAGLGGADMGALDAATKTLKRLVSALADAAIRVPGKPELDFAYGVVVVDGSLPANQGEEAGICFFAEQQVDRSPTGSAVGARVALAVAKGQRRLGEEWRYHSIVSLQAGGDGAFVGVPVEEVQVEGVGKAVIVETRGRAWYAGTSTFIAEEADSIGKDGFELQMP